MSRKQKDFVEAMELLLNCERWGSFGGGKEEWNRYLRQSHDSDIKE